MMEKKLTVEELVAALRCCNHPKGHRCSECPVFSRYRHGACKRTVDKQAANKLESLAAEHDGYKEWLAAALSENTKLAERVQANHRAQQPNEPLTLDELRKMDGQPVWCNWINGWALIYIDGNSELEFVYHDGSYNTFDELKNVLHECKIPFIAYRNKPEAGETE